MEGCEVNANLSQSLATLFMEGIQPRGEKEEASLGNQCRSESRELRVT